MTSPARTAIPELFANLLHNARDAGDHVDPPFGVQRNGAGQGEGRLQTPRARHLHLDTELLCLVCGHTHHLLFVMAFTFAVPVRVCLGSGTTLGVGLTRLRCTLLGCRFLVSVGVCLGWASTLCCPRGRRRFARVSALDAQLLWLRRPGLVVAVRMRCCVLLGCVLLVLMPLVFVMLGLVCGLARRRPRGDRRRAPGLAQETQGLGSAFPRSRHTASPPPPG